MTPLDTRLLARYLEGQTTPDETAAVLAWIGNDPERQSALDELSASFAADARRLAEPYDADAAWSRVAAQHHIRRVARVRRTQATTWALAASLLIVFTLGGWWTIVSRTSRESTTAQAPQEREYGTARAQRAQVSLADGSEVTLNADSRLRVPANFGKGSRDVYLDGEGYFSVAHDTTAPFTVHTSRGTARDIGTKFNVRAYADDRAKDLQVVVADGVVAIGAVGAHNILLLRKAEAGRITADGELLVEHGVDVNARIGWTEGRLEFKNTPLRDVIPVIARWYDAQVRIGDSVLADYPLTVTLTGERFDEAIDGIARVLDARVVRRDGIVVLWRR